MIGLWLILFLILLFIELITVNLITIWFAVGAVGAFITTYITDNFIIQIVVFIVISVITLLLTKPIVKKVRNKNIEATNLDRVIGKTGVVTKEITKDNYGEVKVEGSIWTATSTKKIEEKSRVKILKIEGVKLLVEKIEEEK